MPGPGDSSGFGLAPYIDPNGVPPQAPPLPQALPPDEPFPPPHWANYDYSGGAPQQVFNGQPVADPSGPAAPAIDPALSVHPGDFTDPYAGEPMPDQTAPQGAAVPPPAPPVDDAAFHASMAQGAAPAEVPLPDAVTGGGYGGDFSAPTLAQPGLEAGGGLEAPHPLDALTSDDAKRAAEDARQAAMTPEERAVDRQNRLDKAQQIHDQLQLNALDAMAKNDADAMDTWKKSRAIADAKSAAIDQDAKDLAATGIDNGHWWASRTTGEKISTILSAAIGGWLSLKYGGKNSALEMIANAQHEDIESQKFDIQNRSNLLGQRRGAVAELYARSGDMYHAETAVQLAAYQNTIQQLDVMQRQYDPNGTSAANAIQAKAVVQQQMQMAKQASDDHVLKVAGEQATLAKTIADTNKVGLESLGLKKKLTAGPGAPKPQTPEQMVYDQEHGIHWDPKTGVSSFIPGWKPDPNALPTTEASNQQDAANKARESGIALQKHSLQGMNGKPLLRKDGTPVVVADETQANKLRTEKLPGTYKFIKAMQAVDDDLGYGVDWLNTSDRIQRVKSNMARAFEANNEITGSKRLTEQQIDEFKKKLGGGSPTDLWSMHAGIEEAIKGAKEDVNIDVRAGDAQAASVQFEHTVKAQALAASPEENTKAIISPSLTIPLEPEEIDGLANARALRAEALVRKGTPEQLRLARDGVELAYKNKEISQPDYDATIRQLVPAIKEKEDKARRDEESANEPLGQGF